MGRRRALAGSVVAAHDLDIEHSTVEHLQDEGLIEVVDLGGDDLGLTLTEEGRDLLDSHVMDREDEELFTEHYRGAHAATTDLAAGGRRD